VSSESTVIIAAQSEVISNILRKELAHDPCSCLAVRDAAGFDHALRTTPRVALALLDVMIMARDEHGRERPLWQILATRQSSSMPVICFSSTAGVSSDTPLFTPPPETMTIASPQDFLAVASIVRTYLELFERQPALSDAIAGHFIPSIKGSFQEFDIEAVLRLLELGAHTGVIIVRDGIHIGLLACEDGRVVHALAGPATGQDAFNALFTWHQGRFAFFYGMMLGKHTVRNGLENLILEANRTDDEVSDLAEKLPPHSYVRRVKGYTDQLPGRRLTLAEWEVLSLVDRYHIVHDLLSRSHLSNIVVMKALRSLMREHLVEVVTADQPGVLMMDRV
jgi:hypothetical protein